MTDPDATIGMQLARQGRFAEALPHLDRANRNAPADVALLNAVGNLLVLAGRGAEATERYRIAERQVPNDLKMLCGWARVSLMLQQPDRAVDLFDRAVAIDPRCADPGGWLQDILSEVAGEDAACRVLDALVARHPAHAGLRFMHAQRLQGQHRPDAARATLEAFLALRPQDLWAHIELAVLAANRGDLPQAQGHYRAVLRADPAHADALWGLAELAGWRLDANLLAGVRRALAARPPARARVRLHEALARHHQSTGDYAEAWSHAGSANALALAATSAAQHYDARQHECRIDVLVEHCTASLLARLGAAGNADPRPLFVIGLPRSGTTLLERVLAAHPDIVGVGEQRFAEFGWKRALAGSGNSYETLTPAAVAEAAAWHLQRLQDCACRLGLAANARRIVDKMPDNYLLAGWLAMAFPRATFIHVQRDPRDVAVSCWFAQFTERTKWINDLQHIVHRIEQHRRVLRHWRTLLGNRLVEVRYEDLVTDHARETRRILSAMDMPWHAQVLRFFERGGYVTTASRMQVREPLHTRSVGRWRNYAAALSPVRDRLDAVAARDLLDLPHPQFDPSDPPASAP
ncbi:MAG: sulfotransferase [Proteobacteria bacterium]|nr:sulfotransferase [Pseudomonadota bacterium]MBS0461164.1 sulfotransferase [Pseudomonadota bacterium]